MSLEDAIQYRFERMHAFAHEGLVRCAEHEAWYLCRLLAMREASDG